MPSPIRSRIAGRPSCVAGHFDHQILAVDLPPQPLGFVDRALGIFREIRRDLDADKAICAMCRVIYRAQNIGRLLDVLDGKVFEDFADRPVLRTQHPSDGVVIFIRVADCLLEDGRI